MPDRGGVKARSSSSTSRNYAGGDASAHAGLLPQPSVDYGGFTEVTCWEWMHLKWRRFRRVPPSMVLIVCIIWIGISGVYAYDGFVYYQETTDKWTDKATCTLVEMKKAPECIAGPGAGGMGFTYTAVSDICGDDVYLTSEPHCGLLNLAGHQWFLYFKDMEGDVSYKDQGKDALLRLNTTECYVNYGCSAFDFASVVSSKKRRSVVMLYTAGLILTPLGLLVVGGSLFLLLRLCMGEPDLSRHGP